MADNGFPSMTALLGLLAVAGFQNRDKIAEMLGGGAKAGAQPSGGYAPGAAGQPSSGAPSAGGGLGGLLSQFTGRDAGSFLGGGLNDLVDRFTQAGHGDTARSWVESGPNQTIEPQHLEQAIGADTLDHLSQQTGLSRQDLLARLSRNLPAAIDQYTPDGRLPTRG